MKRKRQSYKTISYVVYPPDYVPGAGYKLAKNLAAAIRLARRYGVGSHIHRFTEVAHQRHTGIRISKVRCSGSSTFEFWGELKA